MKQQKSVHLSALEVSRAQPSSLTIDKSSTYPTFTKSAVFQENLVVAKEVFL